MEKKGLIKTEKNAKTTKKNHQYYLYSNGNAKEIEAINGKYFKLDYMKRSLVGIRPYGKIQSFRMVEMEHVMLFESMELAELFNRYMTEDIKKNKEIKTLFSTKQEIEKDFKKRKEIIEKYDLTKYFVKKPIEEKKEEKLFDNIFQPGM